MPVSGETLRGVLVALACAVAAAGCGRSPDAQPMASTAAPPPPRTSADRPKAAAPPAVPRAVPRCPCAVGLRVMRFVDRTRRVRDRTGAVTARTLVTEVRYPAQGRPSGRDLPGAPAARGGPYPLIVFGHGFDLLPETYTLLLRAWARAGYVVAAPAFPLERANAPGGPDESDLVNQPGDMRFVISRMEAALHGIVDPGRIAVAGHSDGGETALAVAYDRRFRDRRVRAAVILSGAAMIGGGNLVFGRRMPPLLAIQGTADRVHLPQTTYAVFAAAGRPKYLLRLLGAGHEEPYSTAAPYRRVVERASIAFLDLYLRGRPSAARELARAGRTAGIAALVARP